MPLVLVSGAFGNVGRSVLLACASLGITVRIFEIPSRSNKKTAQRLLPTQQEGSQICWGDIRNAASVSEAMEGVDAVIHLAALIPPAADRNPALAHSINVGGTANILSAIAASPKRPRLVFSSSVAAYGDRVKDNYIKTTDALHPCADDEYAKQKVECEALVRQSGLDWVICRLSYIVWRKKLSMDALMYRMPLDTSIELCHTLDTGMALARAALCDEAVGKTFNLAGGTSCRTSYRAYLDSMLHLFGLGGIGFLPEEAFSALGYHCGFMDTLEAQALFGFQKLSLKDYYREVALEARPLRFLVLLFRPVIRAAILAKSPFLRSYRAEQGKHAVLHQATKGK